MNAYEALYIRSKGTALLTDNNPELATVFMKVIQGIHNFSIKTKAAARSIKAIKYYNSNGLVLTLRGSGRGNFGLDVLRQRNNDMAEIVKEFKELPGLFNTIYRYCLDRTSITAILSAAGDKIIINGNKREAL